MFMFPASQAARACFPDLQSKLAAPVNEFRSMRRLSGALLTAVLLLAACSSDPSGNTAGGRGGRGGRGGAGGPPTVGFVVVQ
jgi:hypothetical protein